MKRNLLRYSLGIMLAAFSVAWVAAPASANGMGKESSEKKAAHLKKELSLNDDQTAQVKAICDETMEKMMTLHKEKQDRINGVLTPEQKEKYAKKMSEWKKKHHKDDDDRD